MRHVKSYNEGLIERLPHVKKFKSNVNNYNDQFKKEYKDRTISENILIEALFKVEVLLSLDNRYLGAMEAILILEGALGPGVSLKFQEKEEKFLFIKYKTRETYREHIIRLSKLFLKERGIL